MAQLRRWIAAGAVMLCAAGVAVATTAPPAHAAEPTRCDFDGDGRNDLAIGVPGEAGRGAVNLQFHTGNTVTKPALLEENVPPNSRYGAALTCGNFNNDRWSDLAVGAPRVSNLGFVFVYYGPWNHTTGAFQLEQMLYSDAVGVPGYGEFTEWFGGALASGDLSGDGADDLAIGVAQDFEDHSDGADPTGSVVVLYGGQGDVFHGQGGLRLDGTGERLLPWFEEDHDEITYGEFGWSLEIADFEPGRRLELAVGAPGTDVPSGGGALSLTAGRVYLFRNVGGISPGMIPAGIVDQDGSQLAPGAEFGDHFGSSLTSGDYDGDNLADLVVGAPDEDVDHVEDAGEVDIYLSGRGSPIVRTQASSGGTVEPLDRFGWALTAGDYNGDRRDDLAIGSPTEDVGDVMAAGAVFVLRGGTSPLGGSPVVLTQGQNLVPDKSEAFDIFGTSLATVDIVGHANLLIGVPGESGPQNVTHSGAVVMTFSALTVGPVADPLIGYFHQDIEDVTEPDLYVVSDHRESSTTVPYRWPVALGDGSPFPTGEWFGTTIAD